MMFFAFLAFFGMQAYAQKTITGTVIDADGSTIPSANVVVKGHSNIGTITDFDGNYTLTGVPEDAEALVFKSMGLKTQEVAISGNEVNATMEKQDVGIDEVVVVAFGVSRDKKALGYSATSIGGDDFAKSANADAMNSLQGKVAGVSVTSSGGAGTSTKVIIRGYSSVTGNNNPLYVIDGMPIDNSSRTSSLDGIDFGSRGNDINPNDIESMTILKGAAATAQYGPRGANGVIMITTKKGKNQKGISVDVNSSYTASDVLRLPAMQNTFGQGWSGHWADDENGSWGPKMDGTDRLYGSVYDNSQRLKPFSPQENNMYEFYDYGSQLSNSIGISGGDATSNFYLSYGNVTADGVIPTDVDKNVKHTVKFNGEKKGEKFTIGASVNYVRRDGSALPDGRGGSNSAANLYSELLQVPRDMSIVDFQDYEGNPFNTLDYFYTPYAFNPYYALNENQTNFYENRIYGSTHLDYKINKWISATYRVGVDASSFNRKGYEAIMSFSPGTVNGNKSVKPNPGYVTDVAKTTSEFSQDLIITGQKEVGDFTLSGMVGYSTFQRDYKRLQGEVKSLVIPNFYNLGNTDSDKFVETYNSRKRQVGVFGQFDSDYKDFIYLTLTGRQDYSSTLPKDNNHFFYPSVSTSFILSELVPATKNVADLIKFRASWGQAGNDADPYLIDPVMRAAAVYFPFGTIDFPYNEVGGFEKDNTIGNPELKPEITTEMEFGADLRFFKGRLTLDAAYYNRISDGQILSVTIPGSSGFSGQIINFGKVQNSGFELLAGITPVKTRNFTWSLITNFTKNKNVVLELPEGTTEIVLRSAYDVEFVAIEGEPLGVLRAPDFLRDDEGHVIVNGKNGIPDATTEKTNIGNVQPDYILGLTNEMKIARNFDFSFTIDYRPGGYMYSGSADLNYFVGNATQTQYNDRQPFIVPNSVKLNPYFGNDDDPFGTEYIENDVPVSMTNINAYYYHSSNAVANRDRVIRRDFLKLRDISISYTLPKKFISKAKVQNVQLIVSGRNLLLFTPQENNFVDPEASSYGNDLQGSFGEFRTGPTYRSFTGTLRVKF